MAYNSDGYIMLDFSIVDFTKTNQTIEGLYKRCVDIIGTNKFVLVINANRKTPLPSAVSFINNQYVIESVLFNFTISSNDNLFIQKLTPVNELIDDNHVALNTTYSSSKIENLFGSFLKYQKITYTLLAGAQGLIEHDDRFVDNKAYWVGTSVYGLTPDVVSVTPSNHELYIHFEEPLENDTVIEVIIL